MSQVVEKSRAKIQRGAASAVSPLACELLAQDSHPQSGALSASGNHEPVAREISFSRYYDPQFAALERDKLWTKVWQYACREEDIPEVGDRLTYEVAGMSFIIVRSAPGDIRAFHNACLHRGTKLSVGLGSAPGIRCPFHGWEWNLDGSLQHIPSAWDFPQVERERYRLPEVKVSRWGGFVFVNPDPDAQPLERSLGVLPEHFKLWQPEERFTFVHARKRVRANWKTVMEAFLESYHVVETHSNFLGFIGDASTQYDIWDDGVSHVSRLITPSAVPSPHLGDAASVQEALDMTMRSFEQAMPPGTRLPRFDASKGTGRAQIAQWRREWMSQQFGRDFSHLSDADMLDSIQYWMFPNFCPWYGEGLPLVYQFLPLGDDPNESIMDIRLLLPVPRNAPRPSSAPIVELGFEDSLSAAPGFGLLCEIFDQDMSNLPLVQAGMRVAPASHKRLTLGRYQEARIQHFHNVLDHTLGLS
jgi:phenylpropionate dioxygenase-like ring-hydroxylating dioxygenase large terminal subunit